MLQADDSLRCGNRLVGRDTPQSEVEALCGPPSFRDHRVVSVSRYGNSFDEAEIWYYNHGSNQFIKAPIFRDGKLDEVRSQGYGFPASEHHQCQPNDPSPGWSKYRLVEQCGDPVSKQTMNLQAPVTTGAWAGQGRSGAWVTPVYREEWLYNFGPSYFLRVVVLENGVVTEIHNGERGH